MYDKTNGQPPVFYKNLRGHLFLHRNRDQQMERDAIKKEDKEEQEK